MRIAKSLRIVERMTMGALGGIAGGAAEIGWIALYGAVTGIPLNPVARGIVGSVMPALAASTWAAEFGILIHLGLAVALGVGLALVVPTILRRSEERHSDFLLTMLILAVVWAMNFLVVLPHINPAFVHLLPLGVTLLSKLLFGLAAATTFRAHRLRRQRVFVR